MYTFHFVGFKSYPRTRDLTQIAIEVEEARLGFQRIAKRPMVLAQEPQVLDGVDIKIDYRALKFQKNI